MPMFQTMQWLAAALALAGALSFFSGRVRTQMSRKTGWIIVAGGALLLSASSWFIFDVNRGGTLLQRRHGWPKIYSWECISPECTSHVPSFQLAFFLGNSFVYAAGLVLVWTVIAILLSLVAKRRSSSRP